MTMGALFFLTGLHCRPPDSFQSQERWERRLSVRRLWKEIFSCFSSERLVSGYTPPSLRIERQPSPSDVEKSVDRSACSEGGS
jgi:hypothetical protein